MPNQTLLPILKLIAQAEQARDPDLAKDLLAEARTSLLHTMGLTYGELDPQTGLFYGGIPYKDLLE